MSGNLSFNVKCEPVEAKYAPLIQQQIINELKDCYKNIELLPIGSVGHKKDDDFNGDIDIAVKCDTIDNLYQLIYGAFSYLDIIKIESYYIVSIAFPYQLDDDPIKYVQCDFMLMWDKDYTQFRYRCPDYKNNESNYKVGAKIMFTNMVINHCIKERYENLPNENSTAKFDFRPTALYRTIYNLKDSTYAHQLYTLDVNKIVNMCFKDGNRNHFNSVETLWDAIHSDAYRYPEEVKILEKNWFVNCWRKGWTSVVPENFNLSYWTNDEIWEFINEQDEINKINQFVQRKREI